ncbi:acetylglutamate kinase [Litorimonas taeanensis]|uniref:Acetylglutamate kinase n=1 Tax=Litorimonas taeanensis TaxID=568099 RepID=A0A420WL95_9PROT|nr:hypothetical protein [Litorimonas taeanensis]RKQ71682.1 acetylglutamate kinase [Litorimonas taeanensis]
MIAKPVRQTVLTSLAAIGAKREAKFYAELFARQEAERFALIVIDPRCLKNPLLESLISSMKLLFDLGLSPILLVGAMDEDRTAVKFQSQRLSRELDQASVRSTKLNTRTYGLIPDVRAKARSGRLPILEMTEKGGAMNLVALVRELDPNKVIFLQPSGGLVRNGERIRNLDTESLGHWQESDGVLSDGQKRFLSFVADIDAEDPGYRSYIIASPLNLLPELFTTKGSGTLIRRKANIISHLDYSNLDEKKLRCSIEDAFGKTLSTSYFNSDITSAYIEKDYRGGAIFAKAGELTYLSKFWVVENARGEGLAKDIWDKMTGNTKSFYWRSKLTNPFNDWYMRKCEGMQIVGEWRVFWLGLKYDQVSIAITQATAEAEDFSVV